MSWLKDEMSRIDEERQKRLSDKDIRPIVNIGEGVTTVSFDLSSEPKLAKTKFGNRHVMNTVEPEGKCVMMSDFLYETFVKAVQDKKGVVKLNIVRTGKGKEDTKYVVQVV